MSNTNYDALVTEGFTKYGAPGFVATNAMVGYDWTTFGGLAAQVTTTLDVNTPGYAMIITCPQGNSADYTANINLTANYARVIFSFYVASPLNQSQGGTGIMFSDNGAGQIGVYLETNNRVTIRAGSSRAAILATSAGSVNPNTAVVIGGDIGINNTTGYWHITINGVLDPNLDATGQNTRRGSANNYLNQIGFNQQGQGGSGISTTMTVQHLICALYTATGGGDSYFTTNPVVHTVLPNGDNTVAFTPQAGVLGQAYSQTTNTNAPGANQLFLRKFTPAANATLNSVSCVPAATNAGAKFKGVVYSDSAGSPNALLSSGTEVVGTTNGTTLTGPLVTPQSLTAGTPYWVGFITDTSVVLTEADTTTTGAKAANTYGSGAPGTAPSMTTGQASWELWGNLASIAHNYPEVDVTPGLDALSYIKAVNVNDEDLYTNPGLTTTPGDIYGVNVKARGQRETSGPRTVNLEIKSGSTTGTGSNSGITPATTWGGIGPAGIGSTFKTDPNGSIAWTPTNLAAAKPGIKIAS